MVKLKGDARGELLKARTHATTPMAQGSVSKAYLLPRMWLQRQFHISSHSAIRVVVGRGHVAREGAPLRPDSSSRHGPFRLRNHSWTRSATGVITCADLCSALGKSLMRADR